MGSLTALKYRTNERSTNEDVWKNNYRHNDEMTNEALLVSKGPFLFLFCFFFSSFLPGRKYTTAVNAVLIQIVMASIPQYIASFRTNNVEWLFCTHGDACFLLFKNNQSRCWRILLHPIQKNTSLVRLSSWDGQKGKKLQCHENQASVVVMESNHPPDLYLQDKLDSDVFIKHNSKPEFCWVKKKKKKKNHTW